ncbi:MAG: 4a-hydroxytetrahydrobiopterin dehydratase [Magnetococcales bacterium]|nr:4a-hydroxytetrahydrobiopterin dehydratase [Magnetococcales bacterium]
MNDHPTPHCLPCEGGLAAWNEEQVRFHLRELPEWQPDEAAKGLSRTFVFKNFHEVMAFVNAVAWIAHQEDHHPELAVSYRKCTVHFSTHAVHGVTENDFIGARKVEGLLTPL